MSSTGALLIVTGAGVGVLALRRGGRTPRRASWDVPPVQKWHAERIAQCAALYQAGRGDEARILLRDRAVDWDLIRAATAAQSLDPVARRIAGTLDRDGSGMFLGELHRLASADRDTALNTIARALADYTGPADNGELR